MKLARWQQEHESNKSPPRESHPVSIFLPEKAHETLPCAIAFERYGFTMEPRLWNSGADDAEQRNVRQKLVRRANELAVIHGRPGAQPTREDVQQAKREVKPLKMPAQRLM